MIRSLAALYRQVALALVTLQAAVTAHPFLAERVLVPELQREMTRT
jgi:hypothetical protein